MVSRYKIYSFHIFGNDPQNNSHIIITKTTRRIRVDTVEGYRLPLRTIGQRTARIVRIPVAKSVTVISAIFCAKETNSNHELPSRVIRIRLGCQWLSPSLPHGGHATVTGSTRPRHSCPASPVPLAGGRARRADNPAAGEQAGSPCGRAGGPECGLAAGGIEAGWPCTAAVGRVGVGGGWLAGRRAGGWTFREGERGYGAVDEPAGGK